MEQRGMDVLHREAKEKIIRDRARVELEPAMISGHFRVFGKHSDHYFNPHELFHFPGRMWRIVQDMIELLALRCSLDDVDMICGIESGGALSAYITAGLISAQRGMDKIPCYFGKVSRDVTSDCEFSVKPFYAQKMKGAKIILMDDVLDSGRSMDIARSLVTQAGGEIVHMTVIADRGRCSMPWTGEVISLYQTLKSRYFDMSTCPMCARGEPITKF